MAKTVLTEEDKRSLRCVAVELLEIRKIIEELAESLVNLSDKELMKSLNANKDDVKEGQVKLYKEKLDRQVYTAEKEFL